MRFLPLLGFLILLLAQPGCKSKNDSELKATEAQRSRVKTCILTTVTESFASAKADPKAVALFADDMVKKAPSDNDKEKDAAFEEYVGGLGCDPNKVGSKNSAGTRIVAEWVISPFNPANAKAPLATNKP